MGIIINLKPEFTLVLNVSFISYNIRLNILALLKGLPFKYNDIATRLYRNYISLQFIRLSILALFKGFKYRFCT